MSTPGPSRRRLAASAAELLAVAVVVCDRQGAARYANRAWTVMTGLVFPQWLGLGWSSVLDPVGRQAAVDGLVSCAGRGGCVRRRVVAARFPRRSPDAVGKGAS